MADAARRSWQIPDFLSAPKSEVFGWQKQQIDDGVAYWEHNPGYQQLEESIRILSGEPDPRLASKQKDGKYSKLQTNRLKRNLREMVSALSDVRFTPGYHSDNNELQSQATLMNRYAAYWYTDRFIDRQIFKAVQWMAITPCGWLEIGYREIPGERGKRVIDVTPHSAFDVVMTGVPESGDHQEAYTVTIIKDLAVYYAHALWPDFQDVLIPDRETPAGWREKIKDVWNSVFAEGPEKTTAKNPTCRLYYTYTLDLSVNKSGKTVRMGSGEWAYDVPSVGNFITTGYDSQGTPIGRPAEPRDCRLFPGRRLTVSNDVKTIYDGPMFDWHGKVPLVKLTADSWPFADFSMVHDVAPIHEAMTELERIAHQTSRNRFWPTLLYNLKGIAREKIKALRTDVSGQRIGYNPDAGTDPVKPLLSHDFYQIPEWYQAFVKYLQEQEDYQMGVRDVTALAKMKVGSAPDSLEKALEMAGPIVKGISRNMERSMRDLAEMFKFLVLQYVTTPQLLKVVGPDGVTPENFDWDPGNLIPSHIPGERTDKPSLKNKMERARYIADHVAFMVTPNSMHEVVQTTTKLLYLQLQRAGFPVSWWRMAEVFQIPNFGKRPEGTTDMISEWFAQQKMMLEFQATLSAEAQGLAGDAGGVGGANGTGSMGPKGGPTGTGGRAPSGGAPPRLAQKDGGARSTIKESR